MAFSKATTVKYVKAVGTFDEAEITEALMDLDTGDVKLLYELTKKMHMKLKSAHTEDVNSRKVQSKQQINKVRLQEKLRHMTSMRRLMQLINGTSVFLLENIMEMKHWLKSNPYTNSCLRLDLV